MPLIKGKSPQSFKENVSTEMGAGKPLPQSLAIAYAMKRKAKKMAQGGYVDSDNQEPVLKENYEEDGDHIDHIMRQMHEDKMSEGGVVSNETEVHADELPNEFDDLVLDDHLSAGSLADVDDEDGNRQEEEDRHDMVAQIMRSREKKDKLPKVR